MKCECKKSFNSIKSLRAHKSNCKVYQKYKQKLRDKILTKQVITKMVDKKLSIIYIEQTLLNGSVLHREDIQIQAKKFGIKLLGIKEIARSEQTRNKYKVTCLKKYGKDNALAFGTTSYKKRNQTVKNKYGVDNIFQHEKIKRQIKKTIFDKYGVDNPTKIPGVRKNVGRKSYFHTKVETWLQENNIQFDSELNTLKLNQFNESLQRFYMPRPDIIISELNLIIEIYGDRWHANPDQYEDSDLIYTWKGELTADTIRNNNFIREKHLNNCGFKVIVLWCSHIKNNNQTQIKQKLLKEIQKWEKICQSSKLKKLKTKPDTTYL